MEHTKLEQMTGGWFIGNFLPTAYQTREVEVGIKSYLAGDEDEEHYHKVATEITVIISGQVQMCGKEWSAGDIIIIPPLESNKFKALTDATLVVVKLPGVLDDKFLGKYVSD